MELEIKKNCTFRELILNMRALKQTYEDTLRSFSYFELREKVQFIRNLRNSIYALDFEEWKKDRIWDYLNGFFNYEELIKIIRR